MEYQEGNYYQCKACDYYASSRSKLVKHVFSHKHKPELTEEFIISNFDVYYDLKDMSEIKHKRKRKKLKKNQNLYLHYSPGKSYNNYEYEYGLSDW